MRGVPGWNFEAFGDAEASWCAAGHHVFSPKRLVQAMGYDLLGETEPGTPEGLSHLKHVMMSDIACIYAVDAIAVIPGWESSRGATVEVALAQFLGLPIYCATTMRELNLVTIPWEFHRKAMDTVFRTIKSEIEEMKDAPAIQERQ